MGDEFTRRFVWNPGEYEVEFRVSADGGQNAKCKYRFTLYESDCAEMRQEFERYKYGFGVAMDDNERRAVLVQISRLDT